MRPTSGFIIAALAVLALAGCSTTAADNTTYARPAASGGAVSIPLN
nr:lipoprotein [uncultured Shinella sp.]